MTWFGIMLCLLGLSSCQAAVARHRRRSDERVGQFFPRNPRETVSDWLSYLAVSASPKRVDFSKNYVSHPSLQLLKDLYPTSHLSQSAPSHDYDYNGDNFPYPKSPYVTDLPSAAAVYNTIADCLHKLKLGAVDQFDAFPKIGDYQESELNNEKIATYAGPTLRKEGEKRDQIRTGEYKTGTGASDKVKSRAGQAWDGIKGRVLIPGVSEVVNVVSSKPGIVEGAFAPQFVEAKPGELTVQGVQSITQFQG